MRLQHVTTDTDNIAVKEVNKVLAADIVNMMTVLIMLVNFDATGAE